MAAQVVEISAQRLGLASSRPIRSVCSLAYAFFGSNQLKDQLKEEQQLSGICVTDDKLLDMSSARAQATLADPPNVCLLHMHCMAMQWSSSMPLAP